MNLQTELFLPALKAALKNEKVTWDMDLSPQDFLDLFHLASIHHVLPMIYEAVYDCPAARRLDTGIFAGVKQQMLLMVTTQMVKTAEFLKLFAFLEKSNIHPIVVKGIVCRHLYPNPDYRISGDEDILIQENEFADCHRAMMDYGMVLANPQQDIFSSYEVPYGKVGSPVYIEVHKHLFPPDSEAYGSLNHFFEGAEMRQRALIVNHQEIETLNETDHLFYLICHAFKHFLHSGFGIRQVCDIVLFANTYGPQLDWIKLYHQCHEIHAGYFAASIFQIGEKYLTFSKEQACQPEIWSRMSVDEAPMLQDLLCSGVYGNASMSRKHSSTITLEAAAADKHGKKSAGGIRKSLFPSIHQLEGRYAYLKNKPFLLPVAWGDRILNYVKETQLKNADSKASDAIKIGNARVELMRYYGIIQDKKN